jgi:hypothetical protein
MEEDWAECQGCTGAQQIVPEPGFFEESQFWGPVTVGVVTTVIGAVVMGLVMRAGAPVGG